MRRLVVYILCISFVIVVAKHTLVSSAKSIIPEIFFYSSSIDHSILRYLSHFYFNDRLFFTVYYA